MTLLSMSQEALKQLNLPAETTIVGNTTSDTAVQLLRLAQEEGDALARRYQWQALQTEKTFTTLAQASQTGAIPTDFSYMVPETFWNRTLRRRVYGPLDAEEWQRIQASVTTLVNPAYRIMGDAILLTPTPTASQTCAYEYISKNWCQSSGGTGQQAWAADTDTGKLDEKLMTLGLVWRFKQAKGMSFEDDLMLYERRVSEAMMRDGSKGRLSSDGWMYGNRQPTKLQIPETITF